MDFLLSAEGDAQAAKRFLRQAMNATPNSSYRVINVDIDKETAYPKVITQIRADKTLPKTWKLQQNKYLNNLVEQAHRLLECLVKPGLGFKSFHYIHMSKSES